MKIGVLGSGVVAQTLASGFLLHGYEVLVGTRDVSKLDDWAEKNGGGQVGSFEDAATFGDLVVLAVKGTAALDVMRLAGADATAGKAVLDTTNPITDAPPVNAVLSFFTGPNESLMEQLQSEFPSAKMVKAFNSVGCAKMVNPVYAAGKPTMFICGNDESAKQAATSILEQFGWDVADMGGVEAARAIEPLSMLWCIPGFLRNEWTHAFALLK
jgi:8-hydroxy-5-deazaflavin:NADPH oxidoreductase